MLIWLAWLAVAGLACFVWGLFEAKMYRVVEYKLPVLPRGSAPVSVLQVSDLHLRPANRKLIAFLQRLSKRTFDVVLATGDLLGDPRSVESCSEALNGLQARIARYYVFGSSDYYAPVFKNYLDYFLKKKRPRTKKNRTEPFRQALIVAGWIELTNHTLQTSFNGTKTQVTGLDDPHLDRDDRSLLIRDPDALFAMCVVHDPAPYREAQVAGFDLVVSGHTHGGQVRLPFIGAVVTNSTIPTELARGPHKIDGTWLFVTPGLGTGKFAPFRFLNRPEASVLNLVERPHQDSR
ncbi:MAG: metallophosphoesterase [Actinomycetota bacterium]